MWLLRVTHNSEHIRRRSNQRRRYETLWSLAWRWQWIWWQGCSWWKPWQLHPCPCLLLSWLWNPSQIYSGSSRGGRLTSAKSSPPRSSSGSTWKRWVWRIVDTSNREAGNNWKGSLQVPWGFFRFIYKKGPYMWGALQLLCEGVGKTCEHFVFGTQRAICIFWLRVKEVFWQKAAKCLVKSESGCIGGKSVFRKVEMGRYQLWQKHRHKHKRSLFTEIFTFSPPTLKCWRCFHCC